MLCTKVRLSPLGVQYIAAGSRALLDRANNTVDCQAWRTARAVIIKRKPLGAPVSNTGFCPRAVQCRGGKRGKAGLIRYFPYFVWTSGMVGGFHMK